MPSKLNVNTADVNQLKKMINNHRKMVNLAGQTRVPTGVTTAIPTGGLGGTLPRPSLNETYIRTHQRLPSDPEVMSRIITFGSMPSYREDKMKRHQDSLMRSKSIESNLSPPEGKEQSAFRFAMKGTDTIQFSS